MCLLDFYSPLPSWAERRLAIVGRKITGQKCLFSYEVAAGPAKEEAVFLQKALWLTRTGARRHAERKIMRTIQQTIDELRDALTRYIEATYHIGHPIMVRQRRRLLEEAGGIFQFPYLESTPRYVLGERYESMSEIPSAAQEALTLLADADLGKPVIFNPP